jgi:hypothetical protein
MVFQNLSLHTDQKAIEEAAYVAATALYDLIKYKHWKNTEIPRPDEHGFEEAVFKIFEESEE